MSAVGLLHEYMAVDVTGIIPFCSVRALRELGGRLAPKKEMTELAYKLIKIYTTKLDARTCHEPMLASMGMQKAILYNIQKDVVYKHIQS